MEWDAVRNKLTSVTLGKFQYNFLNNVSSIMNRVEQAIRSDGSLIGQQVQGTINGVKAQLRAQSSIAKKQTVRAVLFEDLDPDSPTFGAMCLGTLGFEIASERTADGRDWKWSTFGTGQGFFADFIVAGTMLADRIKGGTLELGGAGNGNGVAKVLNADGNEIVRLDKDGVYAKGKYVCANTDGSQTATLSNGNLTFKTESWMVYTTIAKRKDDGHFIDIMGVRIYRQHITIRRRVFLRVRRSYKKAQSLVKQRRKIPVWLARKCMSYKGILDHTDSYNIKRRYNANKTIQICKGVISHESKIRHYTRECYC